MSENQNEVEVYSSPNHRIKTPIRRGYKKRLTKEQEYKKSCEKVFKELSGSAVNCGEDTVLQSYNVHFDDVDALLDRLNRQKWRNKKYTLAEQSIFLNGNQFIPIKYGMNDFCNCHLNYKYECNAIQIGFTGGDKPIRPSNGAPANVFTKMTYAALKYGFISANKFIEEAILSIPSRIWFNNIPRLDYHIDVAMPFSIFKEYHQKGWYAGRLRKKARAINWRKAKLEGDGPVEEFTGESILINRNGDVEIFIYDKAQDLIDNPDKYDVYVSKFGIPPNELTRIELRMRRGFFRNHGLSSFHSIDTADDWFKSRAAIIREVMTNQFRFLDKHRFMAPEWKYAMESAIEFVNNENNLHGIDIASIQRIKSQTTMTEIQKFSRSLSAIRTNVIKILGRPITNYNALLEGQLEVIRTEGLFSDFKIRRRFHLDGEREYLQYRASHDTSAIANCHVENARGASLNSELNYPADSDDWGVVDWMVWHSKREQKCIS